MLRKNLLLIVCLVFFSSSALFAQYQYIGALKCKLCHNKEATGEQYKKWSESGHAKAWKTLASPKALEIGKAKGIANPQTDPKCLKCHSTAANADKSLIASITVEEGVSCETCHGPGSDYKSMSIMKSIDQSIKNGLILPDEKTCTKCHNEESPTYKTFVFAEFKAKIAHNIPKQ